MGSYGYKNHKQNLVIRHIIGREYLTRKSPAMFENSDVVKEKFDEINRINEELFNAIPFQVVFTDKDVYSSAAEMRKRVIEEGIIYIYNGWSGHPFLTEEQNNIGRAVHDVFAHLVCGCPFTFEGEYTAYLEQRKYYPEWIWDVLFAEIPAQTCAYYANGNSHDFAQRAICAPDSWMQLGDMLVLEDFSHNSVLQFHDDLTATIKTTKEVTM